MSYLHTMDVSGILVEIPFGHKVPENPVSAKFTNNFLSLIEGRSKSRCGDCAQSRSQTVGAFANQELCGTVHGKAEEEGLKIDHVPCSWNCIDKMRYMCLESFDITDLATNEIRSEEFATVLPFLSVGCEDARPNERTECGLSAFWELPVFKFQGLYRFEVVGLTSHDDRLIQCWSDEGIGADFVESA